MKARRASRRMIRESCAANRSCIKSCCVGVPIFGSSGGSDRSKHNCSNAHSLSPEIGQWLQEMEQKRPRVEQENQDVQVDDSRGVAFDFFKQLCSILKDIHTPQLGKRKSPTGSWTVESDLSVVEYCWRKAIDGSHTDEVRTRFAGTRTNHPAPASTITRTIHHHEQSTRQRIASSYHTHFLDYVCFLIAGLIAGSGSGVWLGALPRPISCPCLPSRLPHKTNSGSDSGVRLRVCSRGPADVSPPACHTKQTAGPTAGSDCGSVRGVRQRGLAGVSGSGV